MCAKSKLLEKLLLEYVEQFGLTDAARKYFESHPVEDGDQEKAS